MFLEARLAINTPINYFSLYTLVRWLPGISLEFTKSRRGGESVLKWLWQYIGLVRTNVRIGILCQLSIGLGTLELTQRHNGLAPTLK